MPASKYLQLDPFFNKMIETFAVLLYFVEFSQLIIQKIIVEEETSAALSDEQT